MIARRCPIDTLCHRQSIHDRPDIWRLPALLRPSWSSLGSVLSAEPVLIQWIWTVRFPNIFYFYIHLLNIFILFPADIVALFGSASNPNGYGRMEDHNGNISHGISQCPGVVHGKSLIVLLFPWSLRSILSSRFDRDHTPVLLSTENINSDLSHRISGCIFSNWWQWGCTYKRRVWISPVTLKSLLCVWGPSFSQVASRVYLHAQLVRQCHHFC